MGINEYDVAVNVSPWRKSVLPVLQFSIDYGICLACPAEISMLQNE